VKPGADQPGSPRVRLFLEPSEGAPIGPERVEHLVDLATHIGRFVGLAIVRASSLSRKAATASALSKK
jgi:hypothetical protein